MIRTTLFRLATTSEVRFAFMANLNRKRIVKRQRIQTGKIPGIVHCDKKNYFLINDSLVVTKTFLSTN